VFIVNVEDRLAMGERIKNKRTHLDLTQEELAESAGTSKQTISMAERGKRELFAGTVIGLSRALNVSADFLLTGQGETDDYEKNSDSNSAGFNGRQKVIMDGLSEYFADINKGGSGLPTKSKENP
jgi:transcriptional regulator with XRE-family HTH domain